MENEMENGGRSTKWSMMYFRTSKAVIANFISAFLFIQIFIYVLVFIARHIGLKR